MAVGFDIRDAGDGWGDGCPRSSYGNLVTSAFLQIGFSREFDYDLAHYVAPPHRFTCGAFEAKWGIAQDSISNEGMHTQVPPSEHTLASVVGPSIWATRVIARRRGQHGGLPRSTVPPRLGLKCQSLYMGAERRQRQSLNVYRDEAAGCRVIPVTSGPKPEGRHERGDCATGLPILMITFYIIAPCRPASIPQLCATSMSELP